MYDFVDGIQYFRRQVFDRRRSLFERLVQGQAPKALFITCSDSRIDPNLLLGAEPGDLFILRNAGNIIPRYGEGRGGEDGTIELAVRRLGVEQVVVCGHTCCAAVGGILFPDSVAGLPAVSHWLDLAETSFDAETRARCSQKGCATVAAVECHVAAQLRNLQTHPAVEDAIAEGRLQLHGWVYHLESGQVTVLDDGEGTFKDIHETFRTAQVPVH